MGNEAYKKFVRPYFAELPYYLWGQVNYDSDGDCEKPTDRSWKSLYLENRETEETLTIRFTENSSTIDGKEPLVARARRFFAARAGVSGPEVTALEDKRHLLGMKRANAVAQEFCCPYLTPFDSNYFWGSWKWIGGYASDFTSTGRLIMHSVVRNDPRAVSLAIEWLKEGTVSSKQSVALRSALSRWTGMTQDSDKAWVRWYYGGFFARGQQRNYPKPDFEKWQADLKSETVLMIGEA